MNSNHPDFKKIQKISKYFDSKPMFFDWDMKQNKSILRPYNKKIDVPQLTYIAGIPYENALDLHKLKFQKIEDNVFRYNKSTLILDTEGNPIMQIVISSDGRVSKGEHPELGFTIVRCPKEIVSDFIELVKREQPKCFSL